MTDQTTWYDEKFQLTTDTKLGRRIEFWRHSDLARPLTAEIDISPLPTIEKVLTMSKRLKMDGMTIEHEQKTLVDPSTNDVVSGLKRP
jgi:hypothetical protein